MTKRDLDDLDGWRIARYVVKSESMTLHGETPAKLFKSYGRAKGILFYWLFKLIRYHNKRKVMPLNEFFTTTILTFWSSARSHRAKWFRLCEQNPLLVITIDREGKKYIRGVSERGFNNVHKTWKKKPFLTNLSNLFDQQDFKQAVIESMICGRRQLSLETGARESHVSMSTFRRATNHLRVHRFVELFKGTGIEVVEVGKEILKKLSIRTRIIGGSLFAFLPSSYSYPGHTAQQRPIAEITVRKPEFVRFERLTTFDRMSLIKNSLWDDLQSDSFNKYLSNTMNNSIPDYLKGFKGYGDGVGGVLWGRLRALGMVTA